MSKIEIPEGFNNVIVHYAKNNKVPIFLTTLKDLAGADNFQSNLNFLTEMRLGRLERISKDKCRQCEEQASVRDSDKGILTCSKGHKTEVDPLSLSKLELDPASLRKMFYTILSDHIEVSAFNPETADYSPFGACGFEPIATTQVDGLKVIFLVCFKHLRLRDAATLQGLIANTLYDSFILFIEGIDENAERFLSYNTGGAVQFASLDDLTRHDSDIESIAKRLTTGLNAKTIQLQSYLKNELRNVQNIVTPEMYRSLLEYDTNLVSRSFQAATTGLDDEFEDIVARLLGALLPVTQLGHNVMKHTGGRKVDAPDGIMQIPKQSKGDLELIFYDCKSVGTESKEGDKKKITQPDEDAFARYCGLFRSEKMPYAKLIGGAFIANDFSGQNLANKSGQIRKRSEVPTDVQIIYIPLKTLVKLYMKITTQRNEFSLHFQSDAIYKLLGRNLDGNEEQKLKSDTDFDIFDTLRKSNTNAVYIIESLVDIFFDHVLSLKSRNTAYLPFILDISEDLSSRY